MAVSRTKKTSRSTARKAARSKPTQNAVRRKKRTGQRQQAVKKSSKPMALPGWKQLATSNERQASPPPAGAFIAKMSTMRFALLLLGVAATITFYVGHVQATQEVLAEVQQARRDNLRLHLKLNRLKGDFDRATSPAVVYKRARELGLEEGYDYGATIQVQRTN